jgi:hypothetical protein
MQSIQEELAPIGSRLPVPAGFYSDRTWLDRSFVYKRYIRHFFGSIGDYKITSGINGEYQRDMLSSLATSVIIPGIDRQLASDRQEIAGRRCLGISSYPLPVAIADALRFHGDCTADTGIAAAGQSLATNKTNSLSDVASGVQAAMAVHQALYGTTKADTSQTSAAKTGSNASQGNATAANGTSPTTPTPATATAPGKNPSSTTNSAQSQTTIAASGGANSNPLLGESVPIDQCEPLSLEGTTNSKTGQKSSGTTDSVPASPTPAH